MREINPGKKSGKTSADDKTNKMATSSLAEKLLEEIGSIPYAATVAPLNNDNKLSDDVFKTIKRSMKDKCVFNCD